MDAMKIKGSWLRNKTAEALRQARQACGCQSCECDEMEDTEQTRAGIRIGWCLLLATVLFIGGCFLGRPAHASITDDQAIRILIGEASNQGFKGMVAVGEVLRHRGSIKGFYGLKSAHVDKQPAWVWEMAKKAWETSKTSNYTKGADHFENIKAFGTPKWASSMVITAVIGSHTFYKQKGT